MFPYRKVRQDFISHGCFRLGLGDCRRADGSSDLAKKAILLLGAGGNGKSTYLSLIVRFLGKINVATIPLHRLEVDKFSVSRLVGKLANICADLPSEHLAGTSTFKALTGGDTLSAEYKFKDSLTWTRLPGLSFQPTIRRAVRTARQHSFDGGR